MIIAVCITVYILAMEVVNESSYSGSVAFSRNKVLPNRLGLVRGKRGLVNVLVRASILVRDC